jgi:hypothetical protein
MRSSSAIICFLMTVSTANPLWSQIVITGTVREKESNAPLQFVNVFLSSSTTGTTTGEDGAFRFVVPQQGKYELVASFIGYQSFKRTVFLEKDSTLRFNILLPQQATELAGIVVVADSSARKKNLKEFKRLFVGESSNASSCEIVNPESIYVYLDRATQVLSGFSRSPIIIDNMALGYRIHYALERFEFNYLQQTISYLGTPRFEELTPRSNSQLNHWKKNRKRTYEGSLNNLLRDIVTNTLQEHGWDVTAQSPLRPSEASIHGRELMAAHNPHQMNFRGRLLVTFTRENDPRVAPSFKKNIATGSTGSGQYSEVEITQTPLILFDNGYFEPQTAVVLGGYLGWSQRISELLPLGYRPQN